MDRRDFLLLRASGPHEAELSCERLYMRYADAASDAGTSGLLAVLEADLARTRRVRVTRAEWLVDGELKRNVQNALSKFESDGGIVHYEQRRP
jgi:hypothetical protein